MHDLGVTEDGTFFQAMELLDGWDLQQLVERAGPLPPGRVAALVRQACDALGEAHAHGLVHRDVKPSNLFLTRGGTAVDRLVVLDFGLARDAGGDGLLTQTGAVFGSPAYLAPAMEDATPVGSPAVHLQQFLEAELAAPPVRKWPPAATLAFIVLTCGGFWAAVVVAALKLL